MEVVGEVVVEIVRGGMGRLLSGDWGGAGVLLLLALGIMSGVAFCAQLLWMAMRAGVRACVRARWAAPSRALNSGTTHTHYGTATHTNDAAAAGHPPADPEDHPTSTLPQQLT